MHEHGLPPVIKHPKVKWVKYKKTFLTLESIAENDEESLLTDEEKHANPYRPTCTSVLWRCTRFLSRWV